MDVCVAFSGGVDSSLVLKWAALEAKKNHTKVYAVTFRTRLHPQADIAIAARVAKECEAEHVILDIDEMENPLILDNPVDRCYLCKYYMFSKLKEWAKERGITTILEGSNEDDMKVYRPGIRALKELGIISPLAEAGITKAETRAYARELGISVSDRPSTPCMATRLPYNTRISFDLLRRIEAAEAWLVEQGFQTVRVRVHGEIARLEVPVERFGAVMEQREAIAEQLKALGFPYITLDLEGFRSGSMDIHIGKE